MITQRAFPSSAWIVSAMVRSGGQTWLESRTYYGYTLAQAKRAYRQTMGENGWAMK